MFTIDGDEQSSFRNGILRILQVPDADAGAFDQALQSMLADGRYRDIAQRTLPCPVSIEKLGCK